MRNTLFNRIAIPYVLLILVLLLGLSFYFSTFVKDAFFDSWRQILETDARVLADQVEVYVSLPVNSNKVQSIAQENSKLMAVRITFIDPNGKVIGDSEQKSRRSRKSPLNGRVCICNVWKNRNRCKN